MSRQIDPSKPLSDDDRRYLLAHGEDAVVARFDERFPEDAPEEPEEFAPGMSGTGDGTGEDTEDPGYEEWSADDLRAEIDERNEQSGRTTKISKAGSRADMAARLREDDRQG